MDANQQQSSSNEISLLNTHIQLLAQRVNYLELDLNRVGNKTRGNDKSIQEMKAELTKADELQQQKIERIQLDLSVVFSRFWTVMLGLVGTVLALLVQTVIKH